MALCAVGAAVPPAQNGAHDHGGPAEEDHQGTHHQVVEAGPDLEESPGMSLSVARRSQRAKMRTPLRIVFIVSEYLS